jgi:hypothetical protein
MEGKFHSIDFALHGGEIFFVAFQSLMEMWRRGRDCVVSNEKFQWVEAFALWLEMLFNYD